MSSYRSFPCSGSSGSSASLRLSSECSSSLSSMTRLPMVEVTNARRVVTTNDAPARRSRSTRRSE
eukprot:31055-Pelagococcus_subviridis.AAC.2